MMIDITIKLQTFGPGCYAGFDHDIFVVLETVSRLFVSVIKLSSCTSLGKRSFNFNLGQNDSNPERKIVENVGYADCDHWMHHPNAINIHRLFHI